MAWLSALRAVDLEDEAGRRQLIAGAKMDLRAHHIGLVVSNLEQSLAFYEKLGFEVESALPLEDPSRSITFMRLGDFRLELFWYAETPSKGAEGGLRHVGFRHLALATSDVDAVVAALKQARLLAPDAQIRDVADRYRLIFVTDPDGTEIEITQEL